MIARTKMSKTKVGRTKMDGLKSDNGGLLPGIWRNYRTCLGSGGKR